MARGRMLNKSVCASKKLNDLSDDTCRLLATWTIANLDCHGVFYGDPAMIRSYVFPRRCDLTVERIKEYVQETANIGLVILFTSKGDTWQWWPGFADNQVGLRADRESTNFPPPPDIVPDQPACDDGKMTEECRSDDGKEPAEEKLSEVKLNVSEGKLSEENDAPTAAPQPEPSKPSPTRQPKLSEGQREYLELFGAKRFKTRAQREAILMLEHEWGPDKLLEAGRWAAERGMNVGASVAAVRGALPKWGEPKHKGALPRGRPTREARDPEVYISGEYSESIQR